MRLELGDLVGIYLRHDEEIKEIQKAIKLQLRSSEQILILGERIMTVVSDFIAMVNPALQRLEASQDGIAQDIIALKAKVEELQGGVAITPAEQEALSQIAARLEAQAVKAEANDAMTPPVPPVVPPV